MTQIRCFLSVVGLNLCTLFREIHSTCGKTALSYWLGLGTQR